MLTPRVRVTDDVRVKVIAVPDTEENVHEIRVEGEFGRLTVKVENLPSRTNPRTS